jgi:transcription initiation factor TFIIH subunit 4
MEQPIALTELESWVRQESYKFVLEDSAGGLANGPRHREDAFGKLRRLHLIHEEGGKVSLDEVFKKNFRLALTGG